MNLRIIIIFILFISFASAKQPMRYWIYFKDKNQIDNSNITQTAVKYITQQSIARRLQKRAVILDKTDLPLKQEYISKLNNVSIKVHRRSKWLNAISAYLNSSQREYVSSLPFVKKVEKVRGFRFKKPIQEQNSTVFKNANTDYGQSENQNSMIGIPAMHNLGLNGAGIRIALFDTGFLLEHEALQHLQVVAKYDFVQGNGNVANEPGDALSQHDHGTWVLGAIAGYKPGTLIGPAYAAKYLLAKTENVSSETHVEEDNWVAAAEWADSLGADIISTSLGYNIFDSGEGDYSKADMDGNTTIITKAADLAVKKGMAVFAAAGNEGSNSWGIIIAPADGDSVIAMGGVRADKSYWPVSSRGPSADGRTKPDLMAQGQYVFTISSFSNSHYQTVSGTSLSTPLGSGAAALLLNVFPGLTPIALRDSLIRNATKFNNPDNQMGYGLINLEKIASRITDSPSVKVSFFSVSPLQGSNLIQWSSVLEIQNEIWIVSRKEKGIITEVANIKGAELSLKEINYQISDLNIRGGENIVYFLSAKFNTGEINLVDSITVQSLSPVNTTLLQNFPNPFNATTRITLSQVSDEKINLKIFDINGRLVKTILDNKSVQKGYSHFVWDGTNDEGRQLANGTYFLFLKSAKVKKVFKMVLLK